MSHRKPTKTKFYDSWREDAACRAIAIIDPSRQTMWDNINTEGFTHYGPHPEEDVARQICKECPVREMCLKDAIFDSESEGIRGGYRFEHGYVSRSEARNIFNDWGLRAKIKKVFTHAFSNQEVSEV